MEQAHERGAADIRAGGDGRGHAPSRFRDAVTRGFGWFEDAVYIGLGLLLAWCAAALMISGGRELMQSVTAGGSAQAIVPLLDRVLLVLMVIELLYTVQVSFRAHTLVPEPFLLVGIIAATRRILVVTVEFAHLVEKGGDGFRNAMIEVGLLIVMVLTLVVSLRILRQRDNDRARGASRDAAPM